MAREAPAHPGVIVGNWVRMESEDRVTEKLALWSSIFKWPSRTGRSRGASCVRYCWRAIWGCDREPPHGVSATLVSQTLALLGCRRVLILPTCLNSCVERIGASRVVFLIICPCLISDFLKCPHLIVFSFEDDSVVMCKFVSLLASC